MMFAKFNHISAEHTGHLSTMRKYVDKGIETSYLHIYYVSREICFIAMFQHIIWEKTATERSYFRIYLSAIRYLTSMTPHSTIS